MFVLPVVQLLAQTKTITGKVTDEKANGIPNASVSIKGAKKGAIANESGNFTITASEGDILVISATGFSFGSIKITTQDFYTIVLVTDPQSMGVVTALGIKRKKNELPYSAQQVTGEDVSKARTSNFINNLSGKVSGLEIKQSNVLGGSTNIVLRGFKSLTENNQVLFVVDGVPIDNTNTNTINQRTGRSGYDYGNAAADINPDDIESVNVLKGAAATALYGSRAANGVVMIVTKKGKKGLNVTVNTGFTVGAVDPSTFPTYQKQYGAGYGSNQNYGSPDGNFFYFDVDGDGQPDLVSPTGADASWGAKFDPNLQVYHWDAFDVSSPYYKKYKPWVAGANDPISFFEKSIATNNNIAIDANGDKGWFKLSYTKSDEKGILPNSRVVKDLLNFGSAYNITDKVTATVSLNFSKINGLGRYGSGYDAQNLMTNFRQWWQTNVDILELKNAYFRTNRNTTWNWDNPTVSSGLVTAYWDNPYWVRHENYQTDNRYRYFGYASLNYRVADWLSILGRISLDSYDEVQEERLAIGSSPVGFAPSMYLRFNNSFREYNYDLLADVNRKITEELDLKGTIGVNIRRTDISSIRAKTNGGLVIPKLYTLSNSKNLLEAPVETMSTLGVDGIFASATLGYKEFLFLDLTARRDRSSSLPSNQNAYFYPSTSAGFLFSKLIKNTPWLSYGKFRANYAEVGNGAPVQSLADVYRVNTPYGTIPLASVPNTKNNNNLRPEKTKAYEVGIEMAFFQSRVGFDITYYRQRSINQIVPASISRATGVNSKYVNAGEIENRGLEFSMYGTPVKTSDFSWVININWSTNRNRVVSLGGSITNLQLTNLPSGTTINAAEGEPYGVIKGTDYVYTNGQKTVGADGYYLKSTRSDISIGNTNADWIGGISNTFKYKNISLGFLIDVRKGGKIFSTDMYFGLDGGLYPETAGLNDLGNPVRNSIANGGGIINAGVKEDGTPNTKRVDISTEAGAYGYQHNPDAAFVYDASYVKLRELTLTYTWPIKENAIIKAIDVSLIGRNLWIIHKNLPYSDPEESVSSGNYQGFQVGAYPTVRSVGVNIKLKF